MDNNEPVLTVLYQTYLQDNIRLREENATLQVELAALRKQVEECPKDDCPNKSAEQATE